MVVHDLSCEGCGKEFYDVSVSPESLPHCHMCGGSTVVRWDISRRRVLVALNPTTHQNERSVVWRNPRTGSVAYPPANNVPMPARYAKNGYERVEFDNLSKLDKFCKSHNVANEKTECNSGNELIGTR